MIVCGTDFSEHAAAATDVSVALARRLGDAVTLVHVKVGGADARKDVSRERLHGEARRVKVREVPLTEEVLEGSPDEAMVARAAGLDARLLVISALGFRKGESWLLGSVAERTVQTATIPVLVVRGGEALREWAAGGRRLRVLFAVDFSAATDAGVAWLAALRTIGPCDIVACHVYWPPDQYKRLGLRKPRGGFFGSHPEVEKLLERDLARRVGTPPGEGEVKILVRPTFGRAADDLVRTAVEEKADLLVVGSHQRKGLAKLWHGSVSQGIVHMAPMSVACVPVPAKVDRTAPLGLPAIRSVLVTTDFSELANAAIPYAYALLPGGGVVHLLHVIDPGSLPNPAYPHYMPGRKPTREERRVQERELTDWLRELIPPGAAARGVETRLAVVEDPEVAEAISQAAERDAVDVICLASHGRSGVTKVIAGSVASAVMGKSHRPILVIRPR